MFSCFLADILGSTSRFMSLLCRRSGSCPLVRHFLFAFRYFLLRTCPSSFITLDNALLYGCETRIKTCMVAAIICCAVTLHRDTTCGLELLVINFTWALPVRTWLSFFSFFLPVCCHHHWPFEVTSSLCGLNKFASEVCLIENLAILPSRFSSQTVQTLSLCWAVKSDLHFLQVWPQNVKDIKATIQLFMAWEPVLLGHSLRKAALCMHALWSVILASSQGTLACMKSLFVTQFDVFLSFLFFSSNWQQSYHNGVRSGEGKLSVFARSNEFGTFLFSGGQWSMTFIANTVVKHNLCAASMR